MNKPLTRFQENTMTIKEFSTLLMETDEEIVKEVDEFLFFVCNVLTGTAFVFMLALGG